MTARTWILAGVPLIGPEQLVDLFAKFGMTLKPPAGFLSGGPPPDWHDLPALLTDQLFRPQTLAHMVISWIGNVWLYLFALALAASLLAGKPASDRAARAVDLVDRAADRPCAAAGVSQRSSAAATATISCCRSRLRSSSAATRR